MPSPSSPSHIPSVFVHAYAKVNLTLAVLGRRADGYHRLASVMQTVALHDTLRLAPLMANDVALVSADAADIDATPIDLPPIAFACDLPELGVAADNLAVRAARVMQGEARAMGGDAARRAQRGLLMELRKQTPTQAGLGGGSSDAACVLAALDALWGLGLGAARLEALAATLGSDTPFFVGGGTALIGGRGEVVTPLPDAEPLWLILLKPRVGVSTAAIFRALTPADYGDEADTQAVVATIQARRPLPFDRLTNTLEPVTLRAYPTVAAARERLLAAGAPVVRMSGSGPTLYAPFRSLSEAAAVHRRLRADIEGDSSEDGACDAWLCHTRSREQCARALPTQPWRPASASRPARERAP